MIIGGGIQGQMPTTLVKRYYRALGEAGVWRWSWSEDDGPGNVMFVILYSYFQFK